MADFAAALSGVVMVFSLMLCIASVVGGEDSHPVFVISGALFLAATLAEIGAQIARAVV